MQQQQNFFKNNFIFITIIVLVFFIFIGYKIWQSKNKNTENTNIEQIDNKLTQEDKRNLVAKYLRANISFLSPEKEVLGGKFYVTSLSFSESKDEVIVEYEDGHIAFKALAQFSITENGEVFITKFEMITEKPKDPTVNFSKNGTITKNNDGYFLNYEENNKKKQINLYFDENSICSFLKNGEIETQNIDCFKNNWENNSQITISGKEDGDKIIVKTMTIIEKGYSK